jgi:hypothetical protein
MGKTSLVRLALVITTSVLGLVVAASALAGDREVRRAGTCTGAASAKLKHKDEDGRIEVEFEVDQNRNGVRWAVVLRQRGVVVFAGTRTTRGPSGSFELRRLLPNPSGPDLIKARATSPSGQVCRASATF